MNIIELSRKAYQSAKRRGLYNNKDHRLEDSLMLVIDEISECHKASLENRVANVEIFNKQIERHAKTDVNFNSIYWSYIHQSTQDELADICIMCFSVLGHWMHVGSIMEEAILNTIFTFGRNPPELPQNIPHLLIGLAGQTAKGDIDYVALCVMQYCKANNINLDWHIEQKMKYNELRER